MKNQTRNVRLAIKKGNEIIGTIACQVYSLNRKIIYAA